ncbi:MAG: hypothetical protein ACMUEM_02835 [Flavobacteriales bacterium AspAUS03]
MSIKKGFSYFIANDWAVGSIFGFTRTSFKPRNNSTKTTSNTFTIDPFIRKYFYLDSSSFAPYLQLEAVFGWNNKTTTVKTDDMKIT